MSYGNSPFTAITTLNGADRILGPDRRWQGVNDEQKAWLGQAFYPYRKQALGIPEIVSNATWSAPDHVAFIEKHGGKAQIKKCGPDEFLLASVLDLLGEWLKPGEMTSVLDGKHDAAAIDAGVEVLIRQGTGERCVRLETKAGDHVWLEVVPTPPRAEVLSDWAAVRYAGSGFDLDREHDGVVFPTFDYDQKFNHLWIQGLRCTTERGTNAKILEYRSALRLRANHVGFRAQATDEMLGVEESCMIRSVPRYVIDQPFVIAVTREGLSMPIVSAFIEKDCWKDGVGLER